MFSRKKLLPAFSLLILTLVASLIVGGGAPHSVVQGLPDAGVLVGWGVIILKVLVQISMLTTLALAMAAAIFSSKVDGSLNQTGLKLISWITPISFLWLIASVTKSFFTFSYEVGISLSQAFDLTSYLSYLSVTSSGNSIRWQILFVALIFASHRNTRRQRGAYGIMLLALLSLIPSITHSHAAGSGDHMAAVGSLIVHVFALSLWIAGLLALWLLGRLDDIALKDIKRFSSFALWAAVFTGLSGVLNGWIRIGKFSNLFSSYGLLLITKIMLFSLLVLIGLKQRKRLQGYFSNLSWKKSFAYLSLIELLTMGSVLGVAYALGQSPTPISHPDALDPSVTLTGVPVPESPTLMRVLFSYQLDPLFFSGIVLATILYILGVRSLVKRGDRWPWSRTLSFIVAMSLTDFATSGGLGLYGRFAFSFHMIAHMVLATLVPIFLILSAPVTLALRALPTSVDERNPRGTLNAVLQSRISKLYFHPGVALALFDGSLFALYFTPLFGTLMTSHLGHWYMELHFLIAGILFFYLIVGVDPSPIKVPFVLRIVLIFVAMSVHAFFSVALMSSTSLLDNGYFEILNRSWMTDLLSDQHLGGSIGWAMGEVPILVALIATFVQWVKNDNREQARIDRAAARADASGEKDALAQYNEYLAQLSEAEQRRTE